MYLPQHGILIKNYEGQMIDVVRSFIEEEYTAFPVSKHDDMLDCMARILEPDLGVIKPEPRETLKPKWLEDLEDDNDTADFITS